MDQLKLKASRKWERLKDRFSGDSLPLSGAPPPQSWSSSSSKFSMPYSLSVPKMTSVVKVPQLSIPSWLFLFAAFIILHGIYLNVSTATRAVLTCPASSDFCTYTLTNYKGNGRLADLQQLQAKENPAPNVTPNTLSVYFLKKDLLSSSQTRLSRSPGTTSPLTYPDDDIVSTASSLTRLEKRRLGYGYALTINVHIPTSEVDQSVPISAYVLDEEKLRDKAKIWVKTKSVTLPMTFKSTGRKTAKTKSGKVNHYINTIYDNRNNPTDFKIKESTGYSLRGIIEVVAGMVLGIGVTVWWLIDDDDLQDARSRETRKGR